MSLRLSLLVLGAAALTSCDRMGFGNSKSLVGARDLPAQEVLDKETIVIVQAAGERGEHLLNVELSPDDRVTATHTFGTGQVRRDERVIAKDSFGLRADTADDIRQMLWRLRPDTDAAADNTVPLGCHYIFDAAYETQIAYATPARPVLPIFALPYVRDCQSESATEARALIAKSLRAFRDSKVITSFPGQG